MIFESTSFCFSANLLSALVWFECASVDAFVKSLTFLVNLSTVFCSVDKLFFKLVADLSALSSSFCTSDLWFSAAILAWFAFCASVSALNKSASAVGFLATSWLSAWLSLLASTWALATSFLAPLSSATFASSWALASLVALIFWFEASTAWFWAEVASFILVWAFVNSAVAFW